MARHRFDPARPGWWCTWWSSYARLIVPWLAALAFAVLISAVVIDYIGR